jgi:hypothetical protein
MADEYQSHSSKEGGGHDGQIAQVLWCVYSCVPHARPDLWEGESASKYVKAQDFSRTGMTRHRFEEMLSAWEFSDAPKEKPDGMPVET